MVLFYFNPVGLFNLGINFLQFLELFLNYLMILVPVFLFMDIGPPLLVISYFLLYCLPSLFSLHI